MLMGFLGLKISKIALRNLQMVLHFMHAIVPLKIRTPPNTIGMHRDSKESIYMNSFCDLNGDEDWWDHLNTSLVFI